MKPALERIYTNEEWERHYEDVQRVSLFTQLSWVTSGEKKLDEIKGDLEERLRINNETIQAHEDQNQARLKSIFSRVGGFLERKLFTYDGRTASDKLVNILQAENRSISNLARQEERKLQNFKFYLYQHSPYNDVRMLMSMYVDEFIGTHFKNEQGANGDRDLRRRFQNLLYFSRFGGAPFEDGSYLFNVGSEKSPAVTAAQSEINFLFDLGLIRECRLGIYKDNLTHAGSGVLKRLDDTIGESVAAQCFRDARPGAPCVPSI